MKRMHKETDPKYRPLVGYPYKKLLLLIAAEFNKTSMLEFDDLSTLRHAVYELWNRVFPDTPFPPDADILRTPYHKDPEVR